MLHVQVIPNVFYAEELLRCWQQELSRVGSTAGRANLERELEQIGLGAGSGKSRLWSDGWVPVNSSLEFDPTVVSSVAADLLGVVNAYATRSAALTGSGLHTQTVALREDLLNFQVRLSTVSTFADFSGWRGSGDLSDRSDSGDLCGFGDWCGFDKWDVATPTAYPVGPPVAYAELGWFQAQTVALGAVVAVRERDEFWVQIAAALLRARSTPVDEPEQPPMRGLDEISARTSFERALPRETRAGPTGQHSNTDADDPDPNGQSRLGVER